MEYITKKEFENIPKEYKTTIAETIRIHKQMYNEDITKLYEDLGYDTKKDFMILASSEKGTILKPVKIKEEN